MLRWSIVFLVVALVAALFGFTELQARLFMPPRSSSSCSWRLRGVADSRRPYKRNGLAFRYLQERSGYFSTATGSG